MSIAHTTWLLGATGLGLFWFVRAVAVAMAGRKREVLTPQSPTTLPTPAPRVSVVLAAKDEASNIEVCVRSLLDQDYPDYEVIAVDDRSTDDTPRILERLQAEFPERLRTLTIQQLRKGWFGKNNAMREAVAASTGEWLLFVDADCRQTSRRTLTVAMADALEKRVDFLSITPVLDTPTAWECMIQPVCAFVLILWFLPEKVNDPASRTAYANGAFMLLRRDGYDAIGGHERVRTEVNEDVRMAQFTKRMGLALRVTENEGLYRTRMYDTPRAAWHGWSRIFYGCLQTMRRLLISAGQLVLVALVPWVCLLASMIGWTLATDASARFWMVAVGAWAIVVGLQQIVMWRVYRMVRVAPVWSLTYVVGATITVGMLVSAMLKVLGASATTWRGTTYRGHRMETAADDASPAKPATFVNSRNM